MIKTVTPKELEALAQKLVSPVVHALTERQDALERQLKVYQEMNDRFVEELRIISNKREREAKSLHQEVLKVSDLAYEMRENAAQSAKVREDIKGRARALKARLDAIEHTLDVTRGWMKRIAEKVK